MRGKQAEGTRDCRARENVAPLGSDDVVAMAKRGRYHTVAKERTVKGVNNLHLKTGAPRCGIYVDLISGEPLFAFGDLLPIFSVDGKTEDL
jgi:hypothetical protein